MAKKIKRDGTVSSETPLCIRFKPGDLDRVRDAAARDGVLRSVWIREAALERVEQILGGMEDIAPLTYEKPGMGIRADQVCIRFRPRDFELIQRAAAREKTLPSPWIRAVVMHRVDQSAAVEDKPTPKARAAARLHPAKKTNGVPTRKSVTRIKKTKDVKEVTKRAVGAR